MSERLFIFLALFALFALLEAWLPRRARAQPRHQRWSTNITISIVDTISLNLLAFAMPLLAAGAALDAQQNDIGLLNQIELPAWLAIILTILFFDFAIWFQHLISHKIPFLWRFHRMHHADTEIDVTTAIRFHPVEIAFSMLLKIGLVYLTGAPFWGIVAFEIILNGTAMFNHANLALPRPLDALLRRIIVTPDMHRVHHSVRRTEHDSNYGFALSVWDQLFGTYIAQPQDGHQKMELGLQWQDERPSKLVWSLLLPFRNPK